MTSGSTVLRPGLATDRETFAPEGFQRAGAGGVHTRGAPLSPRAPAWRVFSVIVAAYS